MAPAVMVAVVPIGSDEHSGVVDERSCRPRTHRGNEFFGDAAADCLEAVTQALSSRLPDTFADWPVRYGRDDVTTTTHDGRACPYAIDLGGRSSLWLSFWRVDLCRRL